MYSATLSQFWGQPVYINAHVLLPDSYYKEPQRRYPVIYYIQGFDGQGDISMDRELAWQRPMRALHREFIIVSLNGMFNGGHQEFADSANNGPWGTALTTEFIPQTDAHLRTIASPSSRFVAGHSSGGWCALWLQVTYSEMFGGEWSISPDPVDFRDFMGSNLADIPPPQNFFHDGSGRRYFIDGIPVSAFVVGAGWMHRQMLSFNSVFSPHGNDGYPMALFNSKTGAIDAGVAQYWEAHYDISHLLAENWPKLRDKLSGKIHVIVGTKDQFGLDRPVRLLEQRLRSLGSDAEFDYVDGANHFTVEDFKGDVFGYILQEASN